MPDQIIPAPQDPTRALVVSPTGETGTYPTADLAEALRAGFRMPTGEEATKYLDEKRYGEGFANELKALGIGALRGADIGTGLLGKGLEAVGGPTLAEQEKYLEYNPASSMAGNVLGVGVSAAVPLGPVGLLGKGTGKVATALFGKAAERGLVKSIAASTLDVGLQGAAFGAGQSVNEYNLGDPTLNAQKVLHNVGIGFLLGAPLGALGGAAAGARRSWLVGKYGRKEPVVPPATPGSVETSIEGTGIAKPKGAVTLEGTIDFGAADDAVVKDAAPLATPGVKPFNKNDLAWLKKNGEPDAKGRPTIFKKIGTEEIPTANTLAEGQVTDSQAIHADMNKFRATLRTLSDDAEKILAESGYEMPKAEYKSFFQDQISQLKGRLGRTDAQVATRNLKRLMKQVDDVEGDVIAGPQLKDNIRGLWLENQGYLESAGAQAGDLVDQSLASVHEAINNHLKGQIPSYGAAMDQLAPLVQLNKRLQRQFGWRIIDKQTGTEGSILGSNWVQNRVRKPIQDVASGVADEDHLLWARNLREFSDVVGRDWHKIVRTNLLFSKLKPLEALGGQRGSATYQVLDALTGAAFHPAETAKNVLKGAARVTLTGEMPEFYVNWRAKAAQKLLLGEATPESIGTINRLAETIRSSMAEGRGLFNPASPLLRMATPASVRMLQLLADTDDLDETAHKLETLIALERATEDADRKVASGVRAIFSAEAKPHELPERLTGFLDEQTAEKHAQEWEKIAGEFATLASNPSLFVERLAGATEGIDEAAPDTAAAMHMTAVRAVQFLNQRLALPDRKALDRRYTPSRAELVTFARYMRIINNPFAALADVGRGTVSRETMQVLTEVMPEFYDEMRGKVLAELAKAKPGTIPMAKRNALAYFLGTDLDASMSSSAIARNQALLAGRRMQQQAQEAQARPGALAKSKGSNRLMTPLDRVANR